MLNKIGKRIEDENGELVAVLTNTQRKADRIRERHGVPAFVGLDLEAKDVARLLDDAGPDSDPVPDSIPTPDPEPDLASLSRQELDDLAAELGIDLDQIDGSGRNGNVIADDVRAAIEDHRDSVPDPETTTEATPDADAPDEPAVSDPEDIAGNDD